MNERTRYPFNTWVESSKCRLISCHVVVVMIGWMNSNVTQHIDLYLICKCFFLGALSVPDIGDQGFPSTSILGCLLCDVTSVPVSPIKLFMYLMRCLPLLLFTSIFPVSTLFSVHSLLIICPTNWSCLFLIMLRRDLSSTFYLSFSWSNYLSFLSLDLIIICEYDGLISLASIHESVLN